MQGSASSGTKWVMDSGCTQHMTGGKEEFSEIRKDNLPCKFSGSGSSCAMLPDGQSSVRLAVAQEARSCGDEAVEQTQ